MEYQIFKYGEFQCEVYARAEYIYVCHIFSLGIYDLWNTKYSNMVNSNAKSMPVLDR